MDELASIFSDVIKREKKGLADAELNVKGLEDALGEKIDRLNVVNIKLELAYEETTTMIQRIKNVCETTVLPSNTPQASGMMSKVLPNEPLDRDHLGLFEELDKLAFRCPVCSLKVAKTQGIDSSPVSFNCGHTSCSKCYVEISNTTSKCPVCLIEIPDPPSPIPNFAVIEMTSSLENFRAMFPRPTTGGKTVSALSALRRSVPIALSDEDSDSSSSDEDCASDDENASKSLCRRTDPEDKRSCRSSYCPVDAPCPECSCYIQYKKQLDSDSTKKKPRNKACRDTPSDVRRTRRGKMRSPAFKTVERSTGKRPANRSETDSIRKKGHVE